MNTKETNTAAVSIQRRLPVHHVLVLLLAAATLAGCARRYDVILTNGMQLSNIRKPIRNDKAGYYTFIDGRGRTNIISVARVVEIHPHQKSTFTSPQ